jgi:hypothetical protein
MCAAIGESALTAVVNSIGYGGVFQGDVSHKYRYFKVDDTEDEARCFLKGGKGFEGGGAIAIARAHPDWSAGHIAYIIEGDLANFHGNTAAAEHFYQQWHDEALKIVEAWKSGDNAGDGSSDTATQVKQFQFYRSKPGGEHESTWDAGIRLAGDVNWRFYVAGGVVAFISDDRMIQSPAGLTINGPRAAGLLRGPSYDVDHGKVAQQVVIPVDANRWVLIPGEVTVLDGDTFGPIEGAWINHTIEQNPFDTSETTLTLAKPMAPGKEPAADVTTVTRSKPGGSDAPDGKKGEITVRPTANRAGVPIHQHVLDFLRLMAGQTSEDIIVGTGTNHRQYVAGSSNQSDHWTGDAADLEVGGDAKTSQNVENTGDNIATAALKIAGFSDQEARAMARKGAASFSGGVFPNGSWNGHRVQVLWKTMTGGNHFNHVHVGVK